MVKAMLLWTAVGAGAIYLLDPAKGADRRRRARQLWSENKDQIVDQVGKAADTASTLTATVVEKATSAVGGHPVASKDPAEALAMPASTW